MAWPNTRLRTYLPRQVPAVKASDLNDIQDAIIDLNNNAVPDVAYLQERIWFDHMLYPLGVMPDPAYIISGGALIENDAANGAHGAVRIGGLSGGYVQGDLGWFALPASGQGDFTMRMRLRVTGSMTTGDAVFAGVYISSTGKSLMFRYAYDSHATRWRTSIDDVDTAPNGTNVDISSAYAVFEVKRAANVVTFKIDNVTLHTISSYTSSLQGCYPRFVASSGNARLWVDWADMRIPALGFVP